MKMKKEQITKKIIAYFDKHEDIYNEAAEELDAYNGYLGDDRYYSMDELDELYNSTEPTVSILNSTHTATSYHQIIEIIHRYLIIISSKACSKTETI